MENQIKPQSRTQPNKVAAAHATPQNTAWNREYDATYSLEDIATAQPLYFQTSKDFDFYRSVLKGQVLIEWYLKDTLNEKAFTGLPRRIRSHYKVRMVMLNTFDGRGIRSGLEIPVRMFNKKALFHLALGLSSEDIINASGIDDQDEALDVLIKTACSHYGILTEFNLLCWMGMTNTEAFRTLSSTKKAMKH